MSGYRPIYKRIWKDPDFQELPATEKLLFIYICTNEMTTESGIYPLTAKTIADETGIDPTTVSQVLHNCSVTVTQRLPKGCFKNVIYDPTNKLIFVKKLRKYSTGGRPELVSKSIVNDFLHFPRSVLWKEFILEYPECQQLINGCSTVVQLSDNLKYISSDESNDTKGADLAQIKSGTSESIKNIVKDLPSLKKIPSEYMPAVRQIWAGLKKRRNDYNPGKASAETLAMVDMLKQHFTPENILGAWDELKGGWYSDKELFMMTVKTQIGALRREGGYKAKRGQARTSSSQFTPPEALLHDDYKDARSLADDGKKLSDK